MKNVVIAGYARSPFTFASKGELSRVRPDDLAARVVKALIERTGVRPEDVEDLIVGCAFPEGEQGFNIGRLIGFLTEVLPLSVAGVTVNRFCEIRKAVPSSWTGTVGCWRSIASRCSPRSWARLSEYRRSGCRANGARYPCRHQK